MEDVFKSGVFVVVLAFTLPFLLGWLPSWILQPLLTAVIGLGLVCAVIAAPVFLVLYVIGAFKGR